MSINSFSIHPNGDFLRGPTSKKNHSLLDLGLWNFIHSSKRRKKTLLILGNFFLRCIVFEFFFFIFTIFEKFSQVAILKLEHCGLFYLVAYRCLHNSLFFWKWSSKLLLEKKLKKQNFRKFGFWFSKSLRTKTKFSKWETKNTRFCFGINKLSNAKKKTQCSTFKIATCENFQSWKKKQKKKFFVIWKMTNNWHCLPADRSMVCVLWTAQQQHGQESVRNWTVRASGADNGHQIWKNRLL